MENQERKVKPALNVNKARFFFKSQNEIVIKSKLTNFQIHEHFLLSNITLYFYFFFLQ